MAAVLLGEVLDALTTLGYEGALLDEKELDKAIKDGVNSSDFTGLCICLCKELKCLARISEDISKPSGHEDEETFYFELRAFIRELGCCYPQLSDLEAFKLPENRLLALSFLLTELQAARMLALRARMEEETASPALPMDPVGRNLTLIVAAYKLSVPPPNVTTKTIMQRLLAKTQEALGQLSQSSKDALLKPIVEKPLSTEQFAQLEKINDAMTQEYSVRRKMLLKRADVTVQSFTWSGRMKDKEDAFQSVLQTKRRELQETAPVSIARVLAARQDLTLVEKVSSGTNRSATTCDINKLLLVGKVPDRGGRPQETRPPPEMPSFKKREVAPMEKRDRGGWRGGGKGGRGQGRVQGGWSGSHDGGRGWSGGHDGGQGWSGGYDGGRGQSVGYDGGQGWSGGYDGGRGQSVGYDGGRGWSGGYDGGRGWSGRHDGGRGRGRGGWRGGPRQGGQWQRQTSWEQQDYGGNYFYQ